MVTNLKGLKNVFEYLALLHDYVVSQSLKLKLANQAQFRLRTFYEPNLIRIWSVLNYSLNQDT